MHRMILTEERKDSKTTSSVKCYCNVSFAEGNSPISCREGKTKSAGRVFIENYLLYKQYMLCMYLCIYTHNLKIVAAFKTNKTEIAFC